LIAPLLLIFVFFAKWADGNEEDLLKSIVYMLFGQKLKNPQTAANALGYFWGFIGFIFLAYWYFKNRRNLEND